MWGTELEEEEGVGGIWRRNTKYSTYTVKRNDSYFSTNLLYKAPVWYISSTSSPMKYLHFVYALSIAIAPITGLPAATLPLQVCWNVVMHLDFILKLLSTCACCKKTASTTRISISMIDLTTALLYFIANPQLGIHTRLKACPRIQYQVRLLLALATLQGCEPGPTMNNYICRAPAANTLRKQAWLRLIQRR